MSDHGSHCPFLNRADARCPNYFNLDRLGNAFGYCFGQYQACPVYLELLVERRLRRLTGSGAGQGAGDGTTPLIQITLHGRQHAATYRHRLHAA